MGFLQTVETDVNAALEAAWNALKTPILSLDATLVSQIAQAASTLFSGGFTMTGLQQAVAAVMGSLASDAQVLEQDVAAAILAFGNAISNDLTGAASAAPSSGTTSAGS